MFPQPIKISIGIPTYNQGEFLEYAIKSVIEQTVPPFELVVSNNHSTDGLTDHILKKYSDRIKVIIPPYHLTMMENWNFLCKNLTGDYISLISSDDWYQNNFIEEFLNYIKKGIVLYRFNTQLVNKNGEPISKVNLKSVNKLEHFPKNFYEQISSSKVDFSAFVIERSALERVNYFDTNLNLFGDWGLWLKLSPVGAFCFIPKVVSNYRVNYRPNLDRERFKLKVNDTFYLYTKIQKDIIKEYNLSYFLYKNALQLKSYELLRDSEILDSDMKCHIINYLNNEQILCISSFFEYKVKSYFQKFRETFIKK